MGRGGTESPEGCDGDRAWRADCRAGRCGIRPEEHQELPRLLWRKLDGAPADRTRARPNRRANSRRSGDVKSSSRATSLRLPEREGAIAGGRSARSMVTAITTSSPATLSRDIVPAFARRRERTKLRLHSIFGWFEIERRHVVDTRNVELLDRIGIDRRAACRANAVTTSGKKIRIATSSICRQTQGMAPR